MCVCVCVCVCACVRACVRACVCDVGCICWRTVHWWISLLLLLYCSSLFFFFFSFSVQHAKLLRFALNKYFIIICYYYSSFTIKEPANLMWQQQSKALHSGYPLSILLGPRQVGITSLYQIVFEEFCAGYWSAVIIWITNKLWFVEPPRKNWSNHYRPSDISKAGNCHLKIQANLVG